MTLSILVFIFALRFLAMYLEQLMGGRIDGLVLLQLLGHAAVRMSMMALPVAMLSAALISFGNMGEHYELAALKACGVGLHRVLRPVMSFALLLTALALYTSFEWVPRSNRALISLIYDTSKSESGFAIKPGVYYEDLEGYVIRVADQDAQTGTLYDFMMYDFTEGEEAIVTLADSARTRMEPDGSALHMKLYHGTRHEAAAEDSSTGYARLYFDSLYHRFDLSTFNLSDTDQRFRHRSVFSIGQLQWAIDSMQHCLARRKQQMGEFLHELQEDAPGEQAASLEGGRSSPGVKDRLDVLPAGERAAVREQVQEEGRAVRESLEAWDRFQQKERQQIREFTHEYYNRWAMPLTGLVFTLMGASLGAVIRKGGMGAPAVASFGFFALFYGLMSQGWKLAKYGWADAWVGALLPLLVFTPFAVFVSLQAAIDAPLTDLNAWRQLIRRWMLRFWKKSEEKP